MSSQKFHRPEGMHDILPEDHLFMSVIKKHIRHRAREAGFKRITTPILEDIGLVKQAIGTSSDLVQKEMFTVKQGDQEYVLRPENTSGVVRAYIENGLNERPQPMQFYYIEPMFRNEISQKGRYRQFFQYGLEIIGEQDEALDAQLMHTAYKIFHDIGISKNMTVQLNSIGDVEDRESYKQALRDFFMGKERILTEVSRKHLKTNPLRILDTKDEDEQILISRAPKLKDYLSKDAREYHELVCEYLDILKVPYTQNDTLVRGLDYYNRTSFEFTHDHTPDYAFGGGGRYDGLVESLGGAPDTPAVGFAVGMERVIEEMKAQHISVFDKDKIQVFVANIGTMAKKESLRILSQIRQIGIKAMGSMGKSSVIGQMKYADKFDADWCILLGEKEVRDGKAIIKNMNSGVQDIVKLDNIVEEIIRRIGKANILHYRSQGE